MPCSRGLTCDAAACPRVREHDGVGIAVGREMADVDERASIERWGYVQGERAVKDRIATEMDEAERKALDSLARYKFQMFGYWAAIWVHLNRIGGFGRRNPFKPLVHLARECTLPDERDEGQDG